MFFHAPSSAVSFKISLRTESIVRGAPGCDTFFVGDESRCDSVSSSITGAAVYRAGGGGAGGYGIGGFSSGGAGGGGSASGIAGSTYSGGGGGGGNCGSTGGNGGSGYVVIRYQYQ